MNYNEYKRMIREIDQDIKKYSKEFLTLKEIQFLEKLRAVMNKKS